jgi:hypothetical protein
MLSPTERRLATKASTRLMLAKVLNPAAPVTLPGPEAQALLASCIELARQTQSGPDGSTIE